MEELATRAQAKTRWVNTIHYKIAINNEDKTPFPRLLKQAEPTDLSLIILPHLPILPLGYVKKILGGRISGLWFILPWGRRRRLFLPPQANRAREEQEIQ